MLKLSDELHIPTMGEIIRDRAMMAKPIKRQHAAAKINRINSDWVTTPYTANYVLRVGTRILRARARQMAGDAPHFKHFLSLARSNIIGKDGIKLQCQATIGKRLNVPLNKRVEDEFWMWGHRETCSVSGKLNWLAAQRLFVTQLARDGEVLVQKVSHGEYGFSLKFIDVSYLDEMYNATLPGGNRVIMSVELDADNRPVAYWLTTPPSDINFTLKRERIRTRVAAEEMIHAFLVYEDETQVRGLTWFHAALLQGKSLASYIEGVITSARITAMSVGFLQRDGDETSLDDGLEDEDGNQMPVELDMSPGSMNELPPGYTFGQFDPKQPTQNHAQFKKSMEIDLASALDVPYFELTGDMEAVNYSSARVGLSESRDIWRGLQADVSDMFHREVFHSWLRAAMLSGKLSFTAKEFMEIQNPNWQGRGWGQIDPLKEANADVMRLANKTTSLTSVLAEEGIDINDHFAEIKAEQDLAESMGLKLEYATKVNAAETANDIGSGGDGTTSGTGKDTTGDNADKPQRGYLNGHDHDEFVS